MITTFDYFFFYFLFALLEQVTCNHFPLCTIVYVSKAIFFFLDSRAPQWNKNVCLETVLNGLHLEILLIFDSDYSYYKILGFWTLWIYLKSFSCSWNCNVMTLREFKKAWKVLHMEKIMWFLQARALTLAGEIIKGHHWYYSFFICFCYFIWQKVNHSERFNLIFCFMLNLIL